LPIHAVARAACAALWIGAAAVPAAAPAQDPSRPPAQARQPAGAPSARQRQQLQSEQRQLQQRLARLKKQLADAEASHSEAADDLAESEASISDVNRRLRELAQARRQVERQIAGLQDRSRSVETRQTLQRRQLGQVARAQYLLVRQAPWQRWLSGASPESLGRDLRQLDRVAASRARSIGDLRERREELAQLEAESLVRQAELAGIAQEEAATRAQLLRQQAARKRTLARLSRQITAQRQSIASLARDEQRLASLVEELSRVLAEQARRNARRAAARPPSEAGGSRGTAADSTESGPAIPVKFAQLRGRLRLPVAGEISARFGSPRRTEAGVDAPTWKGVFIRAPVGTEVRAIAAGRVVFADWLRGFGNLLIVDHGDGVLSVYGNNESLLCSVGDPVEADEVVAEVGNTGGNPVSGLYFELRSEGRPIDPLKWAQAR
jgi:septal ring factor EnvC (AmiA/AmiB activator)